jgi:hypothetical protein
MRGVLTHHAEALAHYRVRWTLGKGYLVLDAEGQALFDAMQKSLGRVTGPFFPRMWTVREWLLLYDGDAEADIRTEGADAWALRQIVDSPENVWLSSTELQEFASLVASE